MNLPPRAAFPGTWNGIAVAIKVLQIPGASEDASQLRSMVAVESAVAEHVKHPHIVQCYKQLRQPDLIPSLTNMGRSVSGNSESSVKVDAKSDRQTLFMVMEFCDRGNLRDAVLAKVFKDEGGRLKYTHVCLTLQDVARAMQHLHASSIVHGDLKARNVLLKSEKLDSRDFVAKVADFGLANLLDPGQTHITGD